MPGMPTRKTTNKIKEEPAIESDFDNGPGLLEEDTVTFKRSHFYAALTVLAFAAGVLLGYVVWGYNAAGSTNSVTSAQAAGPVVEAPVTAEPQFVRYDVADEGYPSLGPADAPIVIIEFSDYQCPYCKRWHDEVYQPLLNAYPGQIRLVYRHLPLTSIHPDAQSAAEAVMCANEQNAYWPFHDKLFAGTSLNTNAYLEYAQQLALDMTAFEACVTERKYQEQVTADSDFAVNLGVRSTPTFFINGLAIVGAQPLDVFQQVIDKELAGEIP
jgi:protein-disulfide isomerase